jgi:hypothetical protein
MRRALLLTALLSAPIALLGCDDDNNGTIDEGGEDGGEQPGEGMEPGTQLLTITPRPGVASATVGTPITLTFDGSVDTTVAQFVDLHRGSVTGEILPLDCTWSDGNSTLACAITTTQPLVADSLYILHIGAGLLSSNGQQLTSSGLAAMGGTSIDAGTVTTHGGQSTSDLPSGWRGTGNGIGTGNDNTIGYAFELRFLPIGGTGTGGGTSGGTGTGGVVDDGS